MMESLRNFLTGPRLIFIVLVCALPFVFLGTGSLTGAFGGSFGSINGEDVTEADLQLASNTAVQRFQSVYGEDFDFDMLDEDVRSESIKQELIVQKVLQAGARSLGFFNENTVTDAKKGIVQNPQFQIEGRFDENVYEAQVNSNGYTKESYIELMTSLLASELYRSSLSGISFATKNEIFDLASLLEKTSDINFIKISYEGLKDQIVNTSTELMDFYDNNQILFFSEEEREFKYIVLDQSDYKGSVIIPDGYLDNSYQDYLSTFDSSAQTRISHIMIDKNNYESSDLAFEKINEVNTLLIDGSNFEEVASQYSEDIVTKDIGGDLDYFESDIFPEEFAKGIENLELNQLSKIIELEDTFHILKVTEINIQEPISEEIIKSDAKNELIETESLALMNDDFNALEDMILNNNSIEEVADSLSKDISESGSVTKSNFNFYISDAKIAEYIFSVDSSINQPYAIEFEDKVIVLAITSITDPSLEPFEQVAEDVADLLSESKAIEKLALMDEELSSIETEDDQNAFIGAYSYISEDTFVDVKRYSSLLPQEILVKIFNSMSGDTFNMNANNGDLYIVNINNFNQLTEDEINSVIEEYNTFGQERLASKMSEIINDDVFESARVNLNNLIF
ncbi:MAG: peptidylprolyl isomerase [SAR86 cluster bacterium]|uniref:Periplasmic chaperone PpiD n=1 Tax=SAR86 cluster bacterium TaxID=2030880 RepID=A0A520N3G0_9GAMM|nr:MAG: peptidylprolyl isomerase [SAR86 cluster bacterium]